MSFEDDNAWQRKMRDRYLVQFYQKYWPRYIFLDTFREHCWVKEVQKRFAIDTVVQLATGEAIGIEEKIERWHGEPRVNFALETESCTNPGHEARGWMYYAQAELLYYAFVLEDEGGLDLYTLRFQPLRKWFWRTYQPQHPNRDYIMPKGNRTRFFRVPITEVTQVKAINAKRFLITDFGIRELSLRTNRINLKKVREEIQLESMLANMDLIRMEQEEWDSMSQ